MSDAYREKLIENIRDEIAGWPIGSGYESTNLATTEAAEMAEAVFDNVLVPVLKELEDEVERFANWAS